MTYQPTDADPIVGQLRAYSVNGQMHVYRFEPKSISRRRVAPLPSFYVDANFTIGLSHADQIVHLCVRAADRGEQHTFVVHVFYFHDSSTPLSAFVSEFNTEAANENNSAPIVTNIMQLQSDVPSSDDAHFADHIADLVVTTPPLSFSTMPLSQPPPTQSHSAEMQVEAQQQHHDDAGDAATT